jgi:GxxExxY protein
LRDCYFINRLAAERTIGGRVTENEIAKIVVDCALKVHSRLGPGLLETVYCVALQYELRKAGLQVEREVPVSIKYEDITFDEGFKIDLLVEEKVVLELKSVDELNRVHKKQLLTYLKLTDKRLGLLINFGEVLIRDGISRVVNGLKE